MLRTTREHERMEGLDRRDRQREEEAYRERQAREDDDTLHDLPIEDMETEVEEPKHDGDPNDLKCERVQDRSTARDCEED